MTLEDYNKMFQEQQGCCAICGRHQSEMKRPLNVDHNHLTGIVRKLLCVSCNVGLGLFKTDDGTMLLEKAIKYIRDTEK